MQWEVMDTICIGFAAAAVSHVVASIIAAKLNIVESMWKEVDCYLLPRGGPYEEAVVPLQDVWNVLAHIWHATTGRFVFVRVSFIAPLD